jgi:hypothetical protein
MDRIQTNYAVFIPRFKTNNEEFYKKKHGGYFKYCSFHTE